MIDLDDALARLVEAAPEPPDVSGAERRGRQRRRRRRGTTITTALAVLVVGVGGAVAIGSSRDASHVSVLNAPNIEHVRVTMLDGSQLEITGPESLGLNTLEPAFNAQLHVPKALIKPPVGHSFTVQREAPDEPGAVVGRHPTHDGHELVVYETPNGVDAVVDHGSWTLVVTWNHDPSNWAGFASALNAKEDADGFLVIEPTGPAWTLGPTDAPDVQLGGESDGRGAPFSFFGPSTYPEGCPAADSPVRTAQGWPVSLENGAWWCDADAQVRVHVGEPALVDAAMKDLRVKYTRAP